MIKFNINFMELYKPYIVEILLIQWFKEVNKYNKYSLRYIQLQNKHH